MSDFSQAQDFEHLTPVVPVQVPVHRVGSPSRPRPVAPRSQLTAPAPRNPLQGVAGGVGVVAERAVGVWARVLCLADRLLRLFDNRSRMLDHRPLLLLHGLAR